MIEFPIKNISHDPERFSETTIYNIRCIISNELLGYAMVDVTSDRKIQNIRNATMEHVLHTYNDFLSRLYHVPINKCVWSGSESHCVMVIMPFS